MRLEYVTSEDNKKQAVLRYLAESGDTFYVDAVTGTLVNLSEIERQAEGGIFAGGGSAGDSGGTSAAPESPEASKDSLTDVEQDGIAKMEGVKTRDDLDAAARAIAALGLDKYTLGTAYYAVDTESEEQGSEVPVTATLRYGMQTEGVTRQREVIVNARTGELISVRSWGSVPEGTKLSISETDAQAKAEAFMKQIAPVEAAKVDLYDSYPANEESRGSWAHSFEFDQKENGYFYCGNSINVGVDATDGSISYYNQDFDSDVTFQSPDGIISMDKAIDVWLASYETQLRYIRVITAVDFSKPEYSFLSDMGVSYLFTLKLGYMLERDTYYLGVDAKTGTVVERKTESKALKYDDLGNHWARAKIEKLAQYGVGFAGEQFQPELGLTQIDLIALLVSTSGYVYQPEEKNAADNLYSNAISMGILTREERDDSAVMTRSETVKLILNASGYKPIAELEGIFRTGFADDAAIPAEYYGYAALAQGLGIVSGAPGGLFLPMNTCTRAEAAAMLFNLMSH